MILNKPYYIAETAFHHEGDDQFLLKLINDIHHLDFNAYKFHLLFDLNNYIIKEHEANKVLRDIQIGKEDWLSLFEVVKNHNKEIVLLCNDLESLKFSNSLQNEYPISAVELHSTGLNDIYLLEESLNFNKTIILGVGGSTFDEIKYAIDFLTSNGKNDILLMHGFQNYPTNYEDVNFRRLDLLKKAFNLPLGYADHTDPLDPKNELISILPIIKETYIIEKHVTNVFGEKRIDSQAAISIDQFEKIIDLGNSIYKTIGESAFNLSTAELNYGNTGPMKKALVANKPIKKGEELTREHIAFKRTEKSSSLLQKDFNKLLGSIAVVDINEDEILDFSNVEYQFKKQSFDQFFIKR